TAGGSIKYLPGMVLTTQLLGADGHIYSMENADPNRIYVGIAGQFTVQHPNWHVSKAGDLDQTFSTLSQKFEPGYVEGHDAGGVSITTVNPVLGGKLLFGSVIGERQAQFGLAPSVTGGITPTQAKGDQLPSQGYLALTTPSSVVIGGAPSADFTSKSDFTTTLSSEQLSAYGLSALSIKANDVVLSAGSTLKLADGGSFSVTAPGAIDIAGNVSAAGGSIKLVTDRYGMAFLDSPL